MTEQEWLSATTPTPMLEFLRGKASERKLRLFACACCRRIWKQLQDNRSRAAVELAEQFADGEVNAKRMRGAERAANHVGWKNSTRARGQERAARAAMLVAMAKPQLCHVGELCHVRATSIHEDPYQVDYSSWITEIRLAVAHVRGVNKTEAGIHCHLMRDLFTDRFHPDFGAGVSRTSCVEALAQAAYDERILPAGTLDPTRLSILADALSDAGCTDTTILNHLRSPGPHVRGCFVIDAILGKE